MIHLSLADNVSTCVPFRSCPDHGVFISMRSFRPALLDQRFTGDPWIVGHEDGTAALCLDGYQLTRIHLVSFDLPSLNRVLSQLRQGRRRSDDRSQ
jgi:hypothetical protein